MKFPTIAEITVKDINTIESDRLLSDAVDMILNTPYSQIVIAMDDGFSLVNVFEFICLCRLVEMDTPLYKLYLPPMPTIRGDIRVIEAARWLKKGVDNFAVVDNNGALIGIVTQPDLASSIDPETLIRNYRIEDFMRIKKRNRWIPPSMILRDAVDDMQMKEYDAYLIVEEQKAIGILTSKDILKLVLGRVDLNKPVSEYMHAPVQTISGKYTLKDAIEFMQRTGFNRIVTTNEKEELIGSLSYKEVLSIAHTTWMSTLTRYQNELLNINAKLEKQTIEFEKIAAYDSLTGVYNRRKFLELFVLEHTVMVERGNKMAMMIIDIDHFKKINDSYGHNVGDKVLSEVANILTHALRDVDIVSRWGGDEFVALLPAADIHTAYEIAEERIRKRVEELKVAPIGVTVSIGISCIWPGDDVYSAVEKADKLLYAAKQQGRNCVVHETYRNAE
jgi:diguanylate cyclase (GGDEF)-like protein